MFTINVLDNLSPKGLNLFDPKRYKIGADMEDPDVILVRSRKLHDHAFMKQLKAVGRAGVGTDNIPVDALTDRGVPVFYAPGANANAVKELVLAAMLLGYRHLDEARFFVRQLKQKDNNLLTQEVEANKKKFVGHEISGKVLGVIGLGHIGVLIANAAHSLGMKVLAYDPYLTVDNALSLKPGIKKVNDLREVLSNSDIITLHVPFCNETKHLINEESIQLIKKDSLLLNFSREQIVDEIAVLKQLETKSLLGYITDFPSLNLVEHPKVLSFPHLGASTIEAEENSANMVVRNICNYLEYGIIERSVNFQDTFISSTSTKSCRRFVVINHNMPGMIAHVTQCISQLEYNIENMVNTSKANVALNIIDVSGPIEQENILLQSFESIPGVIRVRSLL